MLKSFMFNWQKIRLQWGDAAEALKKAGFEVKGKIPFADAKDAKATKKKTTKKKVLDSNESN